MSEEKEKAMRQAVASAFTTNRLTDEDIPYIMLRKYKMAVMLEDWDCWLGNLRVFVDYDDAVRGGFTLDELVEFLVKKGAGRIKRKRRTPTFPVYD